MSPSTPTQSPIPTRHTTRVAHTTHLAGHTGPLPTVAHVGRHRVTSETPQHFTAARIVYRATLGGDAR